MKKSLLILIYFAIAITFTSFAQGKKADLFFKKYAPDSLKTWTKEIIEGVGKGHPGMHSYTSKQEFDSLIDVTFSTLSDSLNTLQYYRILKPFFAKIGCLHTSISLSESHEKYLEDSLKLIPLGVFIDAQKKVFVTKNYAKNESIPLRSEILSINGKPIAEILETLHGAIPSDGYNQTLKTLLLNHRFAFWYQSIISSTNHFEIEARVKNSINNYHLTGVSKNVFPSFEEQEKIHEKQLSLAIKDNVGLLTIHSFAKTIIKKNGQNFDKFIKKTFKRLNAEQIENLVIDLRNNSGGTDGNAAKFTSYFFEQPFQYWQKIEVTQDIAGQIKGLARLFYKKPIMIDSSYHWKGSRWWLSKEFNYYKMQKPAKHNYKGNIYLLTNGLCMSSCADVVAILSYNNKAKVIGTETGGGYQGNTSGLMPETPIFDDYMVMTTPLNKYTNAVDPNTNFGRGTIPDYQIKPTLDDWLENRDVELDYAMKLIEEMKK